MALLFTQSFWFYSLKTRLKHQKSQSDHILLLHKMTSTDGDSIILIMEGCYPSIGNILSHIFYKTNLSDCSTAEFLVWGSQMESGCFSFLHHLSSWVCLTAEIIWLLNWWLYLAFLRYSLPTGVTFTLHFASHNKSKPQRICDQKWSWISLRCEFSTIQSLRIMNFVWC